MKEYERKVVPVVKAVQWNKPKNQPIHEDKDENGVFYVKCLEQYCVSTGYAELTKLDDGDWIVRDGDNCTVLSDEEFRCQFRPVRTLDSYIKEIEAKQATGPAKPFQTELRYFRDGNFIKYSGKCAMEYVTQIDKSFCVIREQGTDNIIGFKFYCSKPEY